jgi:hypothetical protein
MPAKAMKLSAEDVKAYDKIIVPDLGRRTIATTQSPTTGACFLEREKYHELARTRSVKMYHEMKNAAI